VGANRRVHRETLLAIEADANRLADAGELRQAGIASATGVICIRGHGAPCTRPLADADLEA
jgi:hypothetical protein